jgi:hypothetical protein
MYFEAGFISVVRTILIILIVAYLFRLIARVLLPWIIKRFINKQQQKFYREQTNGHGRQKREGEVNVKYKKKEKQGGDNVGEYVDYEEL